MRYVIAKKKVVSEEIQEQRPWSSIIGGSSVIGEIQILSRDNPNRTLIETEIPPEDLIYMFGDSFRIEPIIEHDRKTDEV